jgi:hypothetical protein
MAKFSTPFYFGVILLIVAVVASTYVFNLGKPVACTMDAKACPDGSYVGRIAPNCEFATCPTGCKTDLDCVPKQCCHPTSCINKEFKGVCNLACTASCEGPIDCNVGSCKCLEGSCEVVPTLS